MQIKSVYEAFQLDAARSTPTLCTIQSGPMYVIDAGASCPGTTHSKQTVPQCATTRPTGRLSPTSHTAMAGIRKIAPNIFTKNI